MSNHLIGRENVIGYIHLEQHRREYMTKWQASFYVLIGSACYGTLATLTKLSFAQGFTPSETASSHVMFGWIMLWLCVLPMVRKIKKIPGKPC